MSLLRWLGNACMGLLAAVLLVVGALVLSVLIWTLAAVLL